MISVLQFTFISYALSESKSKFISSNDNTIDLDISYSISWNFSHSTEMRLQSGLSLHFE